MQIAMAQARSTWFRVEVVVPFVQAFASFLPRSTTHLFSEERAAQHEGQVRAVPAHDGAVEGLQHSHGVVRRGRATVRCCYGQPSHTHTLSHTLSHSLTHSLRLSHTASQTHSHALSLSHTQTHSHTHTLSFPPVHELSMNHRDRF